MDARQRELFNTLKRILVFVSAPSLPAPLQNAPSGFTSQVDALRAAIADATAHAVNKGSGDPYRRTAYRRKLRDILRYEHLQPIRNIAKVLEKTTPGLPRIVNLPKRYGSEQALITAAQSTIKDVMPFESLFVGRGLPHNFLAQLQSAIDALEQANSDYADGRALKIAGYAGVDAALRAGKDIRQCLTAIVRRCCSMDPIAGPGTLHAWRSVSRIHRVGVQEDLSDEPGVEDSEDEPLAGVSSSQTEPVGETDTQGSE